MNLISLFSGAGGYKRIGNAVLLNLEKIAKAILLELLKIKFLIKGRLNFSLKRK